MTFPIKILGQRTIGAAGFQMNAFGAAVTAGGQATFQGVNAAGGFLIYPSRVNVNQTRSVYSK